MIYDTAKCDFTLLHLGRHLTKFVEENHSVAYVFPDSVHSYTCYAATQLHSYTATPVGGSYLCKPYQSVLSSLCSNEGITFHLCLQCSPQSLIVHGDKGTFHLLY